MKVISQKGLPSLVQSVVKNIVKCWPGSTKVMIVIKLITALMQLLSPIMKAWRIEILSPLKNWFPLSMVKLLGQFSPSLYDSPVVIHMLWFYLY